MSNGTNPDPVPPARGPAGLGRPALINVVLATAIGIAVVGFLVGIRAGVPTDTGRPAADGRPATPPRDVPVAVSYGELPGARLGANAGWTSVLPPPSEDPAMLLAALRGSEADRAGALARRADRRAFDGAPPVVPHTIDQTNAAACVACHGRGLRVGDVVAPRMSHGFLGNCTQCHVEAANLRMTSPGTDTGANRFVGRPGPGAGDRAWLGAPPTIPHATWMRQDCTSCHGVLSEAGLRTSHPWRTNCTQCHVPSAQLDQYAGDGRGDGAGRRGAAP